MTMPVVAIVGRPNVGKSSLFNWLVGKRVSIVDPTAGVTRDRISAPVDLGERYIDLFDTGGIGIEDSDQLTAEVESQIQAAIQQADVILFVVDARAGRVPLDEEVASRLRSVAKSIILVVNKCDSPQMDALASEFYALGYTPVVCVSAEQQRNKAALFDEIAGVLPETGREDRPEAIELKLAIVGRRNVGKSTFINSLAQGERVIVSEVPGTTRDSVDVRFERDGKSFVAIDTAGVRKRKSIANDIEFYSMARAERSIRRADVVLHFLDARLRVSKVDKQLTEFILEHHKPAIFVVNKWDLVKERMPTERYANYLRSVFGMLDYVPIAFITAKSGKNVYKLLNLAQHLHKQAQQRVSTGTLNHYIRQAMAERSPPTRHNRTPKIFYATQADVKPPTIVLFTNGPELFEQTYVRYLVNKLREYMPFAEVPIKIMLRSKQGAAPEVANAPSKSQVIENTTRVEVMHHDGFADDRDPAQESLEIRPSVRSKPPEKRRDEEDFEPELWQDL